jgi:NifU-like protein involved in Fe-S cluster formation
MTPACREACCSATPRFTVSELFERGFRRNRAEPFPIVGEQVRDAEGNSAQFSIELENDTLIDVRFHASSCATLIAYCEAIAELIPGFDTEIAGHITPTELIEALPGVPALKQNRAVLAIAAFRAALFAAHKPDFVGARKSRDPGAASESAGDQGFSLARE